MPELNEYLDREITICARRETVFRYFTDSERFAKWWGQGSQIDARPGGAVTIRYPNAVTVTGEVKEIDPPSKIVFTYAYAGNIPSDGSLVESCVTPEISFRDAFSATDGMEEMLANLEAVQIHMQGMTLARAGDVRQAHGTAIAGWTASAADGSPRGSGTNVFDLAPDGRIRRVVGFWGG
jgi:uncharacterized protein YndB with AHSA1/START domain